MFDLDKKTCTITNVNGRHEKHGEENVLAADIELKGSFDNGILAEFAPALRSCMYEKDPEADLADQAQDFPTKLRFPKLQQPMKWDAEITGASVTLEYGMAELIFDLADIGKFRIELNDGGTVNIMFRVQVRPTEEQLAKLFTMLDTQVPVTIAPPKAEYVNGSDGEERMAA